MDLPELPKTLPGSTFALNLSGCDIGSHRLRIQGKLPIQHDMDMPTAVFVHLGQCQVFDAIDVLAQALRQLPPEALRFAVNWGIEWEMEQVFRKDAGHE